MNVTERDEEQAAAATNDQDARDGASAPQVARARDADPTPGSGSDAPWSLTAGTAIRNGTTAVVRHPRDWAIWDQHPASPRVIAARARESATWDHWPGRVIWALLIGWSALFSLIAVAPRNKTCWLIAGVILICWLTW